MASMKKLTARVTKLESKLERARLRVLEKVNRKTMKAAETAQAQDNIPPKPEKTKKEKKVKIAA